MVEAPVLGLRFLCAVAMLAVGPALVWDGLLGAGVVGPATHGAAAMEWSMLGFVLAAAAVVGFARWQPPAAAWRPAHVPQVGRSYAVFVLPWVVFVVGYLWLARTLGHAVPAQEFLGYLAAPEPARPGFWLVVFGVTVGAPLAEEVVFRGYLQGALQCVLPRWAAIALAAAVFGVCHTLPYALPVGLLGVLFGVLFARHGSLWPSVVAHAVHNGLVVLLTVCWPHYLDLLYPR